MRDFFKGIRMFGQGLGILARSPRLLLIGALPALLTTVLLIGGIVALAFWIDDLSLLITPFADDWSPGWQTTIRVAAGVAVFGVVLAIAMIGFTAITLAVGGPFYEHIAEKVEDDLGGVPGAVDLSWWRLLVMGLKDGLALVLRSLMFTIPLLIAGFIPVVGQTVVPVLLALVTAWFLALELIAVPFYRRGMGLKQRRPLLRRHRALALGLGLPVSLLCLVPFAALIVMPVGFVGGVLVAREVLAAESAPAS
ncbi:EI24 domain-containing protein [Amycolatopsis sp. NPDC049868]|uniref:EI24 domain-containing protein n=1 Tax=Amycolatopsis sp. NPDC049868 TaxID=3363934 RepID=UPI0037ACA283